MTTCNAITRVIVRDFGFEWQTCRQSVGIKSFVSSGGLRVGYCFREGHEASVRRQFAEQADIPEPEWLHETESDDPVTAAKGYADWTEAEKAYGR